MSAESRDSIEGTDIIRGYCTTILLSNNPDEIDASRNAFVEVLWKDTPGNGSYSEIVTETLRSKLVDHLRIEDAYTRTISSDRRTAQGMKRSRKESAVALERQRAEAILRLAGWCVNGEIWPESDFRSVFEIVESHLQGLKIAGTQVNPRRSRKLLRNEISRDVMYRHMPKEAKNRAKLALKSV